MGNGMVNGFSSGHWSGMGNGGYGMGNGGYGMGNGYGVGSYQTGFMGLLFQILFVAVIIVLIVAAVAWVKNYIASEEIKRNSYYENKAYAPRDVCKSCGKALNRDWKVCPYCGKDARNE